MADNFKPYTIVEKQQAWKTPDFNPNSKQSTRDYNKAIQDSFKAFGIYAKKNINNYLDKLSTDEGLKNEILNSSNLGGLVGHINPKDMDKFFEEMLGSTIRNAEGDLIPVYHAGNSLESGLPTKGAGIYSEGVYFSGIPKRTWYYGEKAKNGTTYPMYANIKNPISHTEFTKRFGYGNVKNSKEIRDILVSEGYDGVVHKMGADIWEGVSFFPETQLKSSLSSITPKMKDEMLTEDFKKFNKY